MNSLLRQKTYSQDWVKDFYTQAGIWWGKDPQAAGMHEERVQLIERLCGPGVKRVLDLGAGPGRTAAALADMGHAVVGVELNPTDAGYARELLETPRKGRLDFLEADFYTVDLQGRFDVVTCWQVFGLGSDSDQRRLLRRISQEWLAPEGNVLLDVYNPAGPAHDAGREWRLAPLPGVPGSVEMFERCRYDPIQGRWIDEWQPTAHPENALAQTLRCYTPADLLLLLEGTGLRLQRVEIEGQAVDFQTNRILSSGEWFKKDYNYLVQLCRDA
jgi:SAM-dependent methyltransferase